MALTRYRTPIRSPKSVPDTVSRSREFQVHIHPRARALDDLGDARCERHDLDSLVGEERATVRAVLLVEVLVSTATSAPRVGAGCRA
jgi:hypothetical protein